MHLASGYIHLMSAKMTGTMNKQHLVSYMYIFFTLSSYNKVLKRNTNSNVKYRFKKEDILHFPIKVVCNDGGGSTSTWNKIEANSCIFKNYDNIRKLVLKQLSDFEITDTFLTTDF